MPTNLPSTLASQTAGGSGRGASLESGRPGAPLLGQPVYAGGASLLSGALMVACFPHLDWSFLVWVACAPLLVALLARPEPRSGFLFGYLTGAVFLAGSCYWFVGVLHRYGGLSTLLAAGVLVLFVLVFSMFFGAFGLLVALLARASPGRALVASPFLWVTMEVARTYLITGFPWNLLGYAVAPAGLRQLAATTAVDGLSFLAVATSALAVWLLGDVRRRAAQVALPAWVAALLLVNQVLAPPPPARGQHPAFLVQPNIPLNEEAADTWAPWVDARPLERLVALTLAHVKADSTASEPLVIWPENSAPFYFYRDAVFRGAIENMARQGRATTVIGTTTFDEKRKNQHQNSAVVLDPEGRVRLEYDKIHLVPFGEYVPWWAFPERVGKITSEAGAFVPGERYDAAQTPKGSLGVFICYEAIFPQLVRRLTPAGPGVLVNISNDAWFGDSPASLQHLGMARLRAIENRRFLLRATNDGITAVIDPYGRIVAELAPHERAVLAGRFDYLTARTFYTAHGDVFACSCVVVSTVLVGLTLFGAIRKGKFELRQRGLK